MTDRERIEYLMNIYNLTPSQFADKTGIQRASVSHILADRNKPSLDVFLKIHRAFPDIELNWLVADEGEAPVIADVPQEAAVNEVDNAIAEEQEAPSQVQQRVATTLFPSFMEEVPLEVQKVAPVVQRHEKQKPESSQSDTSGKAVASDAVIQQESNRDNQLPFTVAPQADETLSLKMESECSKRIREIKIFYDNGTYETFVPEK